MTIFKQTQIQNENNAIYTVANPLPTIQSLEVFSTFIDQDLSTKVGFSGTWEDLIDYSTTTVTNTTATNPKVIDIYFKNIIGSIGVGILGTIKNTKITGYTGAVPTVLRDNSADATVLPAEIVEFEGIPFTRVVVEFYTADTITLTGVSIVNTNTSISQIRGIDPTGTSRTAGMTEDGYLTISDNSSGFAIAKGEVSGHTNVHKFGKHDNVGTSYEALSIGGVYNMPQPAAATTVRVKAGNANDTAAGSGAREVTVQGLDETGAFASEAIPTNGTSPSTATTTTFIRLYRAFISESGTYGSITTSSQAAEVVIENGAGGTDWLTIAMPDIGRGQSQIGLYTVPLGFTAYVFSYLITTDSNKAVDFLFFKRESILDAAAPYQAVRVVVEEIGVQGTLSGSFRGGQSFSESTDIGWLVKAATTAEATVDFDIVLVAN